MINDIVAEAQFDSLSLGVKLYNYFDGFKKEEVQLFSYFSSVLFPYTNEPISEWLYRYTIDTENGYPFSADLNSAIDMHILNGNFEEVNEVYTVTTRGMKTFDSIKDLSLFQKRETALTTACTTSILMSYKETERAIFNDPELKEKRELQDNREWISQDHIYDQIHTVSKELGVPLDDIMISSVSWVKYLSLINEAK